MIITNNRRHNINLSFKRTNEKCNIIMQRNCEFQMIISLPLLKLKLVTIHFHPQLIFTGLLLGRNQHQARRGTILLDDHPDLRLLVK